MHAHRGNRRGSILLMAFWCLMALSYAVYGVHEKCIINYRVLSRQVEREQCYWAAVGGAQRVASYLLSLDDPASILKQTRGPAWFGTPGTLAPAAEDPANLAGVFFEVCRKAHANDDSPFNVEDESGRFNINNIPSKRRSESYLRRGGQESIVLKTLLTSVQKNLSFLDDPASVADAIDDEIDRRITKQKGTAASGEETFVSEDVFRHPYDLFSIGAFDQAYYFGEDVNGNCLLDPNENDQNDTAEGRTFPRDDEDGTLDAGLRDVLTTFSDRKFNVYTCLDDGTDHSPLAIMLADYPEVLTLVRDSRNEGRYPNPTTFANKAYPGAENAEKRRAYRAFRADYLTQTEKTDTYRITVQAYQRDGTWRGTLEQVFKLERETEGGGESSRPGGKYFRPLFKYYR